VDQEGGEKKERREGKEIIGFVVIGLVVCWLNWKKIPQSIRKEKENNKTNMARWSAGRGRRAVERMEERRRTEGADARFNYFSDGGRTPDRFSQGKIKGWRI
jgi:uncharacterized protein YbjQ (UPF0145 family)